MSNGHEAHDRLQEINQLINDLEAATQATNDTLTILHGKLAVSQQDLEAKAEALLEAQQLSDQQTARLQTLESELANLKTERDALAADKVAALQQQLATQAHSLQDSQEELELTMLQLLKVQEELEDYFLQNQEIQRKSERETAFLRSKVEERDAMIKEYKASLEQLKRVTLQALGPRPFLARWIAGTRRSGVLQGGERALLLPQGKSSSSPK